MKILRFAWIAAVGLTVCLLFTGAVCSGGDTRDPNEAGQAASVPAAAQEGGTPVIEEATADIIELDEKTLALIGLRTAPAVITNLDEVVKATGKITNNQNNEAHVTSLIPGRVNRLMADWGETVKKGQGLVCLESIDLGMKRAEYNKARAEFDLAAADYARKERLFKQDAVSEKLLLEAEAQKKSAEINREYARKMLLLTGLNEEQLLNPPSDHAAIEGCSVHLVSPIDGVVVERNVVRGAQVEPGTCMYKILDISTVWIEIDVYEKDLPHVKIGGVIKLTVPAMPGRVFTGKIVYIGYTLNESTRTVKVRSQAPNTDFALKPGMFAEVDIVTGSRKNVLAVPREALITDENLSYVFIKHEDHFERCVVTAGNSGDGLVEILSGLSAGTEVVVQGNYQLKSRLLMSGADPHAGHIH